MKLISSKAFMVLNSRAQPTIAVQVKTSKGSFWAGAPAGASTGKKELAAFPQGIDMSIALFNRKIAPKLAGFSVNSFDDFAKVEETINLIEKPTVLGGSAMIALEFSLLKALAIDLNKEIYELFGKTKKAPLPLGNLIGGGAHAGRGASDFQEFLVCPQTKTFSEAALINADLHNKFKKILAKGDRTFRGAKTDEGAWVTGLSTIEILDLLFKERRNAEKRYGTNIFLGTDVAASQFYSGGKYNLSNYSPKTRKVDLDANRYYNYIADVSQRFDLWYVEDPFDENDADSFGKMHKEFPEKLICGDDLTATNSDILEKVWKSIGCVIVKPNQIGSLVKAKEFFDLAKKKNLKTVVSHRSGETSDDVLAHIALGFGADYFKCGISGGERTAKINELIRLGF